MKKLLKNILIGISFTVLTVLFLLDRILSGIVFWQELLAFQDWMNPNFNDKYPHVWQSLTRVTVFLFIGMCTYIIFRL